jgi:hypothetical protein
MTAHPDASVQTGPAQSLHVLGALALELRGDAPVARAALAQAEAGELAAHMARDLATFAPEAAQLQLVTVGAHYDPVELLRPGWALHRELDQLSARAPGDASGRIIAFGAHEGQLPGALAPSPDHFGGPLRLVPFVLGGDAAVVTRVGDQFERELIERGMAGAGTALAAQAAFGLEIEHARYLTAHDLAAMTALQYEHAGLAPLWPLLETALLDPDGEAWLDAPPEPLVRYAGGEARIALLEPRTWKQRYAPDAPCDTPEGRTRLERLNEHFRARQRQIAAVLTAHGVALHFVHCAPDADPLDALRQ